jgi:hypothetical protein
MGRSAVIAMLFDGKMKAVTTPKFPDKANFVICCDYGDWSGFRTLAECERQFEELEKSAKVSGRSDGYYWVEER